MYKKYFNIYLLVSVISLSSFWSAAQNVGINPTGAAPDNSAILDLSSSDKGLLVPRVALSATNSASPISSPATSLLVYNTATAGSAPTNVVPGFYFWDGAAWVSLSTGAASSTVTASNGLTKVVDDVQLGGTLSAATTVDQGTNNLTFSSTGAAKTVVNGSFKTQGAVYANVRTITTMPTASDWLATDYVVIIKKSGIGNIELPDPVANAGRVLIIRNSSVNAGTGGTYTFITNIPANNTTILQNRSNTYISDGTAWYMVTGI